MRRPEDSRDSAFTAILLLYVKYRWAVMADK